MASARFCTENGRWSEAGQTPVLSPWPSRGRLPAPCPRRSATGGSRHRVRRRAQLDLVGRLDGSAVLELGPDRHHSSTARLVLHRLPGGGVVHVVEDVEVGRPQRPGPRPGSRRRWRVGEARPDAPTEGGLAVGVDEPVGQLGRSGAFGSEEDPQSGDLDPLPPPSSRNDDRRSAQRLPSPPQNVVTVSRSPRRGHDGDQTTVRRPTHGAPGSSPASAKSSLPTSWRRRARASRRSRPCRSASPRRTRRVVPNRRPTSGTGTRSSGEGSGRCGHEKRPPDPPFPRQGGAGDPRTGSIPHHMPRFTGPIAAVPDATRAHHQPRLRRRTCRLDRVHRRDGR